MILKKIIFFYLAFFVSVSSYTQTNRPTQIKFRHFRVTVVDFIVKNPAYFERLANTHDTVVIIENPCVEDGAFIDNTIFKVSQKFRKDSFSLSFTFKVIISDLPVDPTKAQEKWTYVFPYRTRPPEIKNEFMIPALNGKFYTNAIKNEYSLKDTTAADPERPWVYIPCFTRNGKIFYYNWEVMYLQIKRCKKGKIKQTKYIAVKLLQKGCDERL